MRLIVVAISMVWITSAFAEDVPLTFQQSDPQSKFRDAQLHVRELMKAGRYKEASEYMPEYQKLSCEASEQKAGRSIVEGAAICARKYDHGGNERRQHAATAESIRGRAIILKYCGARNYGDAAAYSRYSHSAGWLDTLPFSFRSPECSRNG